MLFRGGLRGAEPCVGVETEAVGEAMVVSSGDCMAADLGSGGRESSTGKRRLWIVVRRREIIGPSYSGGCSNREGGSPGGCLAGNAADASWVRESLGLEYTVQARG